MVRLREAFDLLCADGEIAGPIDVVTIALAETELDVNFPKDYREFLLQYGAVVARGIEVYGLIPSGVNNCPPLWQNVVSVAKELRGWGQQGTDKRDLIPISEDGSGVYFYLDSGEASPTKIWAIGPGVEKVFEIDLFSFFVKLSQGEITLEFE